MRYGLYRNTEGYSDPTAGAALSHILWEQRQRAMKEAAKLHSKERRRYNRRLKHQREALHRHATKEVPENDG